MAMTNKEKSKSLFKRALNVIPGGVNSPVRAFKSVGGTPVFIENGKGAYFRDVDGNEYIDYIGSWGPHLFGHNPPFVVEALNKALENGTSFGAPTELEVQIAELIVSMIPSVELVRMVNSGTEATMSAIRLARGFTGKDKIIKFEGCYHGHADSFLIKAGSGALTFGNPTSPGVTKQTASDTLVARYNDLQSVEALIEANKNEIAAIIIEPIAGNMGLVASTPEFISGLRKLCDKNDIILIFDEVMTGFRVSKGGAQEILDVEPDITTFGKIIGGGLPVGAFGGRREILEYISPSGKIYQAGTLSGNPLAMAAGYAMLTYINTHPEVYDELERKSQYLEQGFKKNLEKLDKKFALNRCGSMMCMFMTETPVTDFESALSSDTKLYAAYFHNMLERGIYLAPAQFEVMFISAAHSTEDLDKTIDAHYEALKELD
jgi:glutamate-1-semialdehyde 2,1-aminomutase